MSVQKITQDLLKVCKPMFVSNPDLLAELKPIFIEWKNSNCLVIEQIYIKFCSLKPMH